MGLATGALLAAASVALAGGGYEIKSDSETLTEMTTGGMNIKCPQGSAVVGGGFFLDGEVSRRINGAFPSSQRKFVVTGSNTDGTGTFELFGTAVCDDDGDFGIKDKDRAVDSGTTKTVKARCPDGSTVSGGGFRLQDGDLALLSSYPAGSRKWAVRAQNGGLNTASVFAFAICDLDGSSYTIEKQTKAPPPVRKPRGINADVNLKPKCKGGLEPSGGGFKTKGIGSARAVMSLPDDDLWKVEIATYAGKALEMTGYAVCGSG
ncbi:MAG: hypothetical protein QOI31_1116 [Solirubrobacterales bacterium]|nr:hypothetical protein [Solirubrobacterales bacterium]